MRLLALDFDGVISNSAAEAFVIAARAYAMLSPRSDFAQRILEGLTGPHAPDLAAVEALPAFRAFVAAMPLGNRAEDFGVVLAALEAGHALPDQGAYDSWRAARPPAWLEDFHACFYRERWALLEADPDGWRGLMSPYAPLLDVLRRRAGEVRLAIATAKDRRSVECLLDAYGVRDLFPSESILDKETGIEKAMHLRLLAERFEVALPQITFVDDKKNHLDRVAPLGVRCALAAWGFNGARERAGARERGHLVCGLDDVEQRLFG